jgi:hypothetical protein
MGIAPPVFDRPGSGSLAIGVGDDARAATNHLAGDLVTVLPVAKCAHAAGLLKFRKVIHRRHSSWTFRCPSLSRGARMTDKLIPGRGPPIARV